MEHLSGYDNIFETEARYFCGNISPFEAFRLGTGHYIKKLLGPFLWMGFNCLKAIATLRRQFTFYHSVARHSWYSFYLPRKDERLRSQPWSHPVVLIMGPLDWESSTLTTRSTKGPHSDPVRDPSRHDFMIFHDSANFGMIHDFGHYFSRKGMIFCYIRY